MEIVLSTRNPSKVNEIKASFEGSPVSITTLDEAGITGQAIEDGTTLQENALKKALFVHQQKPDTWAIADDSGIFINALDGKPGVDTANWKGEQKETDQITDWILEQLKNITDRSATFKTIIAVVSPEGEEYFFEGEVKGTILPAREMDSQSNMPYNSIFLPDGCNNVFAKMSLEEENAISHRGRAFAKAREFLEKII